LNTNLSQQIQKQVLASRQQTSVLNFFRPSREHGVREEEALEEEETSDVEEVGCRTAAAMSDISTMPVLDTYMQY
jgi:hypothetical protein